MTPAVSVVEVSPRDGLQNDPVELSTTTKAELIARVVRAGVRRVEATSFVGPRAVPKMADAEGLVEAVRAGDLPDDVSLIGLVVNRRGVDRAAAAGVDEVNVVVVATDTFSQRNQAMTTAESLDRLTDLVGAAHQAGLRASVTVGASFGCPFEGEVAIGHLVEVAARAAAAGVDELALADSIGVAVPSDVTAKLTAVRLAIGTDMALRAHFHNTRNTGLANATAAVAAGVASLDASLGGIGGCPFAPAATGNVPTEDLLYLLERSGVATGISLESLIDAARWLEESLGHPVPGLLSKAGAFPGPPAG